MTLAGCGGGSATQASKQSTSSPSSATSTATTSSSSTSSSTSSLPGAGKPTVTIGDKNYTEQFVLGELYALALQAQGYSVNIDRNIGPTEVTIQALKTGQVDMYPEYLQTFNQSIAGYRRSYRSPAAAYRAAQRYARAHGFELLNRTPFSDTDAIAVTVGFAAANRVKTIADLSQLQQPMTLGGPPQFAQDQLSVVERAYKFSPASYKTLAVGDQYQALNQGQVQAAYVNTTDGQLATGDYQLLDDPDRLFGVGNVVPVVLAKALAQEGPAFAQTVNRVSALLTLSTMRELNSLVDVAHESPTAVATQFLATHGLLALSTSS